MHTTDHTTRLVDLGRRGRAVTHILQLVMGMAPTTTKSIAFLCQLFFLTYINLFRLCLMAILVLVKMFQIHIPM